MSRPLPFVVPGRERAVGDRSEQEGREALKSIVGLSDGVAKLRHERGRASAVYERRPPGNQKEPMLSFYVHEWQELRPELEKLASACEPTELRVTLEEQPFQPEDGASYQLLRVEIAGPHDLLRYLADDCEAYWR